MCHCRDGSCYHCRNRRAAPKKPPTLEELRTKIEVFRHLANLSDMNAQKDQETLDQLQYQLSLAEEAAKPKRQLELGFQSGHYLGATCRCSGNKYMLSIGFNRVCLSRPALGGQLCDGWSSREKGEGSTKEKAFRWLDSAGMRKQVTYTFFKTERDLFSWIAM